MSSVEVGRYKRAVLLLVVCPTVTFSPTRISDGAVGQQPG